MIYRAFLLLFFPLLLMADSPHKKFNISLDLLYLRASETMDWAFTIAHDQNSLSTNYKTFSFHYDPGFRIGWGYQRTSASWETKASYTYFQSTAHGSTKGAVTPAFLAARLSLLEPFSTGNGEIKLSYHLFDGELLYPYSPSPSFSFRPMIGLRGGWIDHTINSKWTTPEFLHLFTLVATEKLTQQFKGGGIRGGFYTNWHLYRGSDHRFSIISQFDLSYLWGHWEIKDRYLDNLNTDIQIITSQRNFGSLTLHAKLGLCWEVGPIQIEADYTIENWLDQVQFFTDASGSQSNDLILQGITAGIRVNF